MTMHKQVKTAFKNETGYNPEWSENGLKTAASAENIFH